MEANADYICTESVYGASCILPNYDSCTWTNGQWTCIWKIENSQTYSTTRYSCNQESNQFQNTPTLWQACQIENVNPPNTVNTTSSDGSVNSTTGTWYVESETDITSSGASTGSGQ